MNTQRLLKPIHINTFRSPMKVDRKQSEVLISDREMAAYKWTALKIAYQRAQAQQVLDTIPESKALVQAGYFTIAVVGLASLGILVYHIF